ncbi:LuxR family transcriptional regulator [Cupriavidus sp. WGtm5]|uniref:response regulator transcription factor n=1 Tax=Cupriavidus sp. WGtm5 TaxID=2919926 RepID=UPI002090F13B|nr:LuxR family transcriptional regulator [Cupriavidus sp. WGtm5]MCO4892183.1 LuxR family transcriptional regulator [Cupriavidus sp. WGtm5]
MLTSRFPSAAEVIDRLDECREATELASLSRHLSEFLGFRYILLRTVLKGAVTADSWISFNNLPPALDEQFRNILACHPRYMPDSLYENSVPRLWLTRGAQENKLNELMRAATAAGIAAGVTCPVHSRNGDASLIYWIVGTEIADADLTDYIEARVAMCIRMSLHLHEALRRVHRSDMRPTIRSLTEREKECLLWIGAGKSTWEIAQILGISEHGVMHHVRKVMNKLGVSRRHDAVRAARALNLI